MQKTIKIQVEKNIVESIECDRCGKECSTKPTLSSEAQLKGCTLIVDGGFWSEFNFLHEKFDICNDCTRDFYKNWIKKTPYDN